MDRHAAMGRLLQLKSFRPTMFVFTYIRSNQIPQNYPYICNPSHVIVVSTCQESGMVFGGLWFVARPWCRQCWLRKGCPSFVLGHCSPRRACPSRSTLYLPPMDKLIIAATARGLRNITFLPLRPDLALSGLDTDHYPQTTIEYVVQNQDLQDPQQNLGEGHSTTLSLSRCCFHALASSLGSQFCGGGTYPFPY